MLQVLVRSMLLLLLSCSVAVSGEQSLMPYQGPQPAPDFELVDVDGGKHRLSDYRGKPLIINFWATWCPPCREEMPSMNRAWRKVKDEVSMLAVNVGEDEDTIFIFSADYPIDFPVLLDRSGAVIKQWPVKGLPTTFVLDRDGNIRYTAVGAREWDDDALLEIVKGL
ncbi:MAG TPA: alkyl hydroperoxide reductase [Gammaproteobacteria bacterium]|nr:alkyl hydroperoxide reductase [Gammaproteobacteria bacterium]